jgi:hypothetical protein
MSVSHTGDYKELYLLGCKRTAPYYIPEDRSLQFHECTISVIPVEMYKAVIVTLSTRTNSE